MAALTLLFSFPTDLCILLIVLNHFSHLFSTNILFLLDIQSSLCSTIYTPLEKKLHQTLYSEETKGSERATASKARPFFPMYFCFSTGYLFELTRPFSCSVFNTLLLFPKKTYLPRLAIKVYFFVFYFISSRIGCLLFLLYPSVIIARLVS